MIISWDRAALGVMAGTVARQAAVRALPVFQGVAGASGVALRVEGASIVSDSTGAAAEYGGRPWVFQGIAALRSGGGPTRPRPFNSIFIGAPATANGIVEGHATFLPLPWTRLHYLNGSDMAQPDLNTAYRGLTSTSTVWVNGTLEKTDGSGDTESWTTCLTRAQLFKSICPLCPLSLDMGLFRGSVVDHPGVGQNAAIADAESADAQAFFVYCKAQGIYIAPQCYPYTPLNGGTDAGTFTGLLLGLYQAHCGGVSLLPIVSRRKLPPMWTGDPDLYTFWSASDWRLSENAIFAAGVANRALFDSVTDDAVVAQYIALLLTEYS